MTHGSHLSTTGLAELFSPNVPVSQSSKRVMRLMVRIQVPTHGADVFPLFVEKLEAEDTAVWSASFRSTAAVKTVCATVEKAGVGGVFFRVF